MKASSARRIVCPRCAAPVTGDYKFCPACAYRLIAPAAEEPTPPISATRLGPALLVGGALVVAAGFLAFGVHLFGGRNGEPPTVRSDRLERPLRIADLPGQLVDLPAGTTFTWRGPPPEYREVEVAPRSVMRHEVTRGQWAEFLRDLEAHPERIPAWLRESLWRNAEYVRPYANRWWDLAEPVLRASSGRTEVRRPAMLEPPLSDEAGLLLLVPPSWLLLTPFDEIEWRLPDPLKGPASENLPVTEISWWDAVAFAEWASTVLSLDPPLHLPFEVEWQRAAHGDDPRRKWVWGDELLLYACNSQNFWSGGGDPAPLPVDYEYSDHPGTTSDGLWAMAGNASEWAWPDPDPDETDPPATAPRCGGSYLEGIDDCRVDSRQYDDKRQRFPDTGFRLVREPGP